MAAPEISIQALKDIGIDEKDAEVIHAVNCIRIKDLDLLDDVVVDGRPMLDEKKKPVRYYDMLANIFGIAIWEMGITEKSMSKSEQAKIIKIGIEELKREFPHFSIQEVSIAFKNGVRGRYGESYGFNISTINKWLDAYSRITLPKAMAQLPKPKPQIQAPPEPKEEEKALQRQVWYDYIQKEFDNFNNTGVYSFYDFRNRFYDICKEKGFIKPNKKEREAIWNRAADELKSELKMSGRNYAERIDYSAVIKAIDDGAKKGKDKVADRAKKLSVKALFEKLLKEKRDISEIIKVIEGA